MEMFDDQQQFFEALKKGDNRAYTQLIAQTKSFCMHYAGGREDGKDVLQNTFIEFIRLIETGRYVYRTGKISSYFITVFTNRWKDFLRKNKDNDGSDIPPDLPDPDPVFEYVEPTDPTLLLGVAVINAFGQLDEKCQERLSLFYINELKANVIAQKMGVAHGTMLNQIMACRNELKQLYKDNVGEYFDELLFDKILETIAQKYIDDNNQPQS
jgi:RNA polymerase sigma factor (sigma-70 family)